MNKDSSKPVIVITAWGVVSTIGQRIQEDNDRLIMARYPGHDVRWVFGGSPYRKKMIASGKTTLFKRQVPIKSLEEVYADLRREGKRNVAVQFFFVQWGAESTSSIMVDTNGLNVEYGYPLLGHPDNIVRVIEALAPRFGGKDTVTILCSHGNKVPALNNSILQLDKYLRKHYPRVFVTTLAGPPGIEEPLANARKLGLPKAKFIPLSVVPGEVLEDVMGDKPTSQKNQLGLETHNDPLGLDPAITKIWMESIDWTLAKFSR